MLEVHVPVSTREAEWIGGEQEPQHFSVRSSKILMDHLVESVAPDGKLAPPDDHSRDKAGCNRLRIPPVRCRRANEEETGGDQSIEGKNGQVDPIARAL